MGWSRPSRGADPEMTTPTILDDPASLATVRASEQSPRAQAETARTARAAVLTDVDDHLVAVHSPQSFEADQYRILRHFLDQHGGGPKRQGPGRPSPPPGDTTNTTAPEPGA